MMADFEMDARFGDLLGGHAAQRDHVLDAGDHDVAVAVADEGATRRPLAQGDQASKLERP